MREERKVYFSFLFPSSSLSLSFFFSFSFLLFNKVRERYQGDEVRMIRLPVCDSRPLFDVSFTVFFSSPRPFTPFCPLLSFGQAAQGQSPSAEKCYWSVCHAWKIRMSFATRLTILSDSRTSTFYRGNSRERVARRRTYLA